MCLDPDEFIEKMEQTREIIETTSSLATLTIKVATGKGDEDEYEITLNDFSTENGSDPPPDYKDPRDDIDVDDLIDWSNVSKNNCVILVTIKKSINTYWFFCCYLLIYF